VPAGIGAFIITDPHWRVGLGIGGDLEKPRKESDAERLRGLGDIDGTVLGAVFASYSDGWFTARGNVVGDIGGKHQGGRTRRKERLFASSVAGRRGKKVH
jgi:outer membrane protein